VNGIAFLIPIALLLGLAGLATFFWSLGSGQYDDLDGASMRILIDEDGPAPENKDGTSP
jgi:cbb3-type cytochrome oxidase maturation protein